MDELTPLSLARLNELSQDVRVPRYERRDLTPGIVHVGLGNFHRAHQAWYLHRLFEQGLDHDWAIIGAGVRPADAAQREKLLSQDCLTTLIELDASGTSAEVIGAMTGFLPVADDNAPLIEQIVDPAIRIVSMTVTEGGYFALPSGGLEEDHPDIRHDAAHPDSPRTVFGAIIAALRRRRADGAGPLTVLSCDNLQGNGNVLRQAVVSLAQLSNPDLASWIDDSCRFPNSMVDCIVPATGTREIGLAHGFGIDDKAPVTHESYRQWVIEDDFLRRPPELGSSRRHVSHPMVELYEAMKIRILNAGHQIIANVGEVLSLETIADCMANPQVRAFFRKVQEQEIAPHVKQVPGMSPENVH